MINKIIMRRFFVFVLLLVSIVVSSFAGVAYKDGKQIKISKEKIRDKIKGGWAGKVIGCTYGFPTEFRYCGTMLQDYIPIRWEKDDISRCFKAHRRMKNGKEVFVIKSIRESGTCKNRIRFP